MYLSLRTDKPEAELYLHDNKLEVDHMFWQAHKDLSKTLLLKVEELLRVNNSSLGDLSGLIVYRGPGSFTGLRIGVSFINTLSYSLSIPAVGETGDTWKQAGIARLDSGESNRIITPYYGRSARITKPRK